ncbi:MAG: hypothetical protein NE327_03460 [Lentisphaeraceae bacterium]|nr:hypothetical protein [Lentisphaeraceae bacterium]
MTSQLVEWYNRNKRNPKLAAVVHVSAERSEDKMYKYMYNTRMTFPAVRYKLGRTNTLRKYFNNYLPCISIVTPKGELIEKSISLDRMVSYF